MIAGTMVLHFLTIYFYILEYTDERSYSVCNIVNRYEISSVKDKLEANGNETTDFHKGFR